MTAVIGILNKTAVALAADSAVSVTGAHQNKIYNTANKIFTLSKYHPVGIMMYNAASFMSSVPWETIIKLYREELEDKTFSRVEEYQKHFIEFLKAKDFFISKEIQKSTLTQLINWNLEHLKNKAFENIDRTQNESKQLEDFVAYIVAEIKQTTEQMKHGKDILPTHQDYSIKEFERFSKDLIQKVFQSKFEGIDFPDNIIELLTEQYYLHLKSKNFIGPWTGLVFSGFGEDDIYPTLTSIKVAEVFDDRLRYFIDRQQVINDELTGSIVPYAQTDVIQTIIEGITPEMDNTFIQTFEKLLLKYNKIIAEFVKQKEPEIADSIENLDLTEIIKEYKNELYKVKQLKQIDPTVQTVAILSKEDLAEMAESLIYLTYLKRRISSDEESVGGPIDVAIISKGDGFIWKKRKHYFDPEYNIHFFENYFKKKKP